MSESINFNQERKKEYRLVIFFIIQSFFLGMFYGIFDISAHTLFLNEYGEEEIANAYVLSGLVGIVITAVYSYLQKKIAFKLLATLNLLFILGSTILLRITFDVLGDKQASFINFLFLGPLNIMALLGFWGLVNRSFTLRQGKRLFAILDTGQIFGIIVSTLLIPIIPLILKLEIASKDLIWASSASVLGAIFVQFNLMNKIKSEEKEEVDVKEKKAKEEENISLAQYLKRPYIKLLAMFVALSMLVAFFIQFSFLTVAKEKFPEELQFTNFLSLFTMSIMIVTFLMKSFVYSNFTKTYGLKLTLVVIPGVLLVLTLLSVIFGITGDLEEIKSLSYLMFFLTIALGKLFSKALKDAFEIPSFKILYLSLKKSIRFDVQAKIDGTINELSALASGLILLGLTLLSFFKLLHFSIVLSIILFIWCIVALKLYYAYKVQLESTLNEAKGEKEEQNSEHSSEMTLINDIEKLELSARDNFLNYLHKADRVLFYEITTKLALDEIEFSNKDCNDEQTLKNMPIEDVRTLEYSGDWEDRLKASISCRYNKSSIYLSILQILLRDPHPEVRKEAIFSSVFNFDDETIFILAEMLDSAEYREAVASALIKIGKQTVTVLTQYFNRSGLSEDALIKTIEILGEIGSDESFDVIISKLNYPSPMVVDAAIKNLKNASIELNDNQVHLVRNLTLKLMEGIAWNYQVKYLLKKASYIDNSILPFIDVEQKEIIRKLFILLGVIYEAQALDFIHQNVKSSIPENIEFAIELLDLLLDNEIKAMLFPLLEDAELQHKIKTLDTIFPISYINTENLMMNVINQEKFLLSNWFKVNLIDKWDVSQENEESIAILKSHINNPDQLMSTMAIRKLRKITVIDWLLFEDVVDEDSFPSLEHFTNLYLICNSIGVTWTDKIITRFKLLISNSESKKIELKETRKLNYLYDKDVIPFVLKTNTFIN